MAALHEVPRVPLRGTVPSSGPAHRLCPWVPAPGRPPATRTQVTCTVGSLRQTVSWSFLSPRHLWGTALEGRGTRSGAGHRQSLLGSPLAPPGLLSNPLHEAPPALPRPQLSLTVALGLSRKKAQQPAGSLLVLRVGVLCLPLPAGLGDAGAGAVGTALVGVGHLQDPGAGATRALREVWGLCPALGACTRPRCRPGVRGGCSRLLPRARGGEQLAQATRLSARPLLPAPPPGHPRGQGPSQWPSPCPVPARAERGWLPSCGVGVAGLQPVGLGCHTRPLGVMSAQDCHAARHLPLSSQLHLDPMAQALPKGGERFARMEVRESGVGGPAGGQDGGDATEKRGRGGLAPAHSAVATPDRWPPGPSCGCPCPPSALSCPGQTPLRGKPGPHLSFGKLSLEKGWDRAGFPLSLRCIRPPSPAGGSVVSWFSVRSLGRRTVRVIGGQRDCGAQVHGRHVAREPEPEREARSKDEGGATPSLRARGAHRGPPAAHASAPPARALACSSSGADGLAGAVLGNATPPVQRGQGPRDLRSDSHAGPCPQDGPQALTA